jgi:antitoxin component of MazEF toxin-antitoxin module
VTQTKVKVNTGGEYVQYPVTIPRSLLDETALDPEAGELQVDVRAVDAIREDGVTKLGHGFVATALVFTDAEDAPDEALTRKYKYYDNSGQIKIHLPKNLAAALLGDEATLSWDLLDDETLVAIVEDAEVLDEPVGNWSEVTGNRWSVSKVNRSRNEFTTTVPGLVRDKLGLEDGQEVALWLRRLANTEEIVLSMETGVDGARATTKLSAPAKYMSEDYADSLRLRFPKDFVAALELEEGSTIAWYPREDRVMLRVRSSDEGQ